MEETNGISQPSEFESGQILGLPPAIEKDTMVYRLTVAALGATMFGSLIVITVLALKGVETPQGVTALGSAALGALAGLLAGGK